MHSQECAQPSISTPYSSTQDSDSASDIDSPGSKQNAFLTRFIHSQRYVAKMSRRLFEAVEENIQLATGVRPKAVHADDGADIIQQLKDKFALTKSRSKIESEMIRIF